MWASSIGVTTAKRQGPSFWAAIFFWRIVRGLRTIVYVDGFNLYYGLLKGSRNRWLSLGVFADSLAGKDFQVASIRYFTARIKPQFPGDHGKENQSRYLSALRGSEPRIKIEEGFYLESKRAMRNANSPPPFVTVLKSEEKGTDVNIACAMLSDAFQKKAEAFLLVSGDSDLATPVRIVRELGFPMMVFNPQERVCQALQKEATVYRQIWRHLPKKCQLPNPVFVEGRAIRKPAQW